MNFPDTGNPNPQHDPNVSFHFETEPPCGFTVMFHGGGILSVINPKTKELTICLFKSEAEAQRFIETIPPAFRQYIDGVGYYDRDNSLN